MNALRIKRLAEKRKSVEDHLATLYSLILELNEEIESLKEEIEKLKNPENLELSIQIPRYKA